MWVWKRCINSLFELPSQGLVQRSTQTILKDKLKFVIKAVVENLQNIVDPQFLLLHSILSIEMAMNHLSNQLRVIYSIKTTDYLSGGVQSIKLGSKQHHKSFSLIHS